jgi:hypothetical protein
MYRTLAPLVSDAEANGGEPLGERSRAVLEREKMLVLRSIKELEFDRAMGKLSAGDFDEMASRLRSRAISLITQLDGDASGYREVIERELQARLGARRAPAVSPPAAPAATARAEEPGPPPVTSAPVAEGQAEAVLPSEATVLALFACDACGTRNDADALFCKRCGARFDTVGR